MTVTANIDKSVPNQSFFTQNELAALLKVARSTVETWRKEGQFECTKVGRGYRIPRESLIKFLESRYGKPEA